MDAIDYFERGRRLFEQALELPADERSAFLNRKCSDDHTLRREVDFLLLNHVLGASLPVNPLPFRPPSASSAQNSALEPGAVLNDQYFITRKLGEGGMGVVYEARNVNPHMSEHRKVALKQARPNYRGIFVREIKILSGLDHPHLPKVYDLLYYGEDRILVMQFIEGTTLQDKLKTEQAFELPQVLDWAEILLKTLLYLHTYDPEDRVSRNRLPRTRTTPQAGDHPHNPHPAGATHLPEPILHQDIKPGNLMLTSGGHLFLMDFGLARSGILHLTTTHDIKGGTPSYAPPEQFEADQDVTVRSDLYALGATLFHLLTGVPPRNALDRMKAVLNAQEDPVAIDLAAWQKQVAGRLRPRDVARWIQKAMALEPADRWTSAVDMLEGLDQIRRRHARPSRFPYWTLVGVMLLLIAMLGYKAYDTGALQRRSEPPAVEMGSEAEPPEPIAIQELPGPSTLPPGKTERQASHPPPLSSGSSNASPQAPAEATEGEGEAIEPVAQEDDAGSRDTPEGESVSVVEATFAFRDGNTAGAIFLDDERLPRRSGLPLAVGTHRLTASRSGRSLRQVTVEYVEAGTPRSLTLTPDAGEVILVVEPVMENLRVFLHME